jgi:hypothetical protein
MDQIVHSFLYKTKFLGINLPPLIKRVFLEDKNELEEY